MGICDTLEKRTVLKELGFFSENSMDYSLELRLTSGTQFFTERLLTVLPARMRILTRIEREYRLHWKPKRECLRATRTHDESIDKFVIALNAGG